MIALDDALADVTKVGFDTSPIIYLMAVLRAQHGLLIPDALQFEALADQLADDFMDYVGPDCRPLSDCAASRKGLYEGGE